MSFKKINYFNVMKLNISPTVNLNKTKFFLSILFLVTSMFISTSVYKINYAYAATSLDQTIQQFQNNLQSNINKQIQSNINNNSNNSNCINNNNIAIQSQTNNNGQTTSTTYCSTLNSFNPSPSSIDLKGIIVGSEYNINTDIITNSLFGNWSLITNDKGIDDFKSSFT